MGVGNEGRAAGSRDARRLRRLRYLLWCARLLRHAFPVGVGAFVVLCVASVLWAASWHSAHPRPGETPRSTGRRLLLWSGGALAAALAAATALREGVRAASARVVGACDRMDLGDLLEASRLEDPSVASFAREMGARRLANLREEVASDLVGHHWENLAGWLAGESRSAVLAALRALGRYGPPSCLPAVERLEQGHHRLPLAGDVEVRSAAGAAATAMRARLCGPAASLLRASERPAVAEGLLHPAGAAASVDSALLRSGDAADVA